MKSFAFVLLFAVGLATAGEIPAKVLKKIAKHHLFEKCWGKESAMGFYHQFEKAQKDCMNFKPTFKVQLFDEEQQRPQGFGLGGNVYNTKPATPGFFPAPQPVAAAAPVYPANTRYTPASTASAAGANPYDAWLKYWAFQQQQQLAAPSGFTANTRRFRRSHHEMTQNDVLEFIENMSDFKEDMEHNIANVTCVLSKMKMLDSQLNVNIEFMTGEMWNVFPNQPDPEFKERVIEGYNDCYQIAGSIPQEVLNKKPITRQFGRHMIFFKCVQKIETKLCAQQEMSRWLEEWYGKYTPEMSRQLGLPEDKFDAAMIAFKVIDHSRSGVEKFVADFVFGNEM